ncbi:MAG: UDP-N-acetylmuramoyl-tripeptide--D-alanyl-D-alanine ligase [Rhodobacteraceae bacterium]|nr:UDP-N-acetylmuramoyl-tripeptide--D-alanyl-D-alanine ligase [Paracoccaceae bacterium]
MSVLWNAADAARATGGTAQGDWAATGLSIDTRSLQPGEMFVALKDRRDGHDFVADALDRGAAAAMVSRIPDGVAADAPLLVVEDVQAALEALGRAARARLAGKVVAVTGSVGKTSTKEMLRAALAPLGSVHAAEKSFNNHWGVPLTLARCPATADVAVIEIGMNHPGEIAPLAAIARPDVALVTIVAPAHLEAFPDGLDGIAHEKATIFSGLADGGTAVLNADLPTSAILRAGASKAAHVIGFGHSEDAQARVTDLLVGSDETHFVFRFAGVNVPVRLATPGRHFATNAAGALAAVAALGGDLHAAAAGLASWRPPGGRGTRETVAAPDGAFALIDDAYNANPASLGAALDVLAASRPAGGRRIAILGDMLELGPDEARLHAAIADHPAMALVDRVHCAGPRMRHLHDALPAAKRGRWAETAAALAEEAAALAGPGDVVLVKGSFGSRVSMVVDALRCLGRDTAREMQDSRECSTG